MSHGSPPDLLTIGYEGCTIDGVAPTGCSGSGIAQACTTASAASRAPDVASSSAIERCGRSGRSTQIAIAQFLLGLSGLVFTLFCLFGLPFLLGSIVWAIVDAILMFTGSVKDNHGRKLR